MRQARAWKTVLTAGTCAAVGAAGGIAGSAAAPAHPRRAVATSQLVRAGAVAVKLDLAGGPPLHGTEIVANKAGDGFDTVTHDSGTVKAVAGDVLTLTEGTDKATYATPALTIPAGATIERNFAEAKLADLQAGDRVDVSASSDGTTDVLAVDSQHWPPKLPAGAGAGISIMSAAAGPPPGMPGWMAGVVHGFTTRQP